MYGSCWIYNEELKQSKSIHKEDLQANWKLLDEGEQFFTIEPLK